MYVCVCVCVCVHVHALCVCACDCAHACLYMYMYEIWLFALVMGMYKFHATFQTELLYKKNPKLLNQFQYCEKELVPLVVIVGEDEKANGGVKIRDVQTRQEVSSCLYISRGL